MGKPIPEAARHDYAKLAASVRQHIPFRENRLPRVPSVAELREWADAFDTLTAAQQPDHIVDATKMVAQQQGQAVALDRMAIRLLVSASFVTEDKANEALRIAHGFDKGPLAPPCAPVGVDGLVVAARKLRDSARGMDDGNRWVPGAVFKQFSKAVTAALATQHQEPTT